MSNNEQWFSEKPCQSCGGKAWKGGSCMSGCQNPRSVWSRSRDAQAKDNAKARLATRR